jgi:hypothetical protein
VAYSESSQRVAAYHEGAIGLYDLRSALRWKELPAGPTQALAFSPSGKFLASYHPKTNELLVWKVGGPGFWAGLGWLEGRDRYDFPIERAIRHPACQIRWKADEKEVTLLSGPDILNFRL